jgi:hypothetical protein
MGQRHQVHAFVALAYRGCARPSTDQTALGVLPIRLRSAPASKWESPDLILVLRPLVSQRKNRIQAIVGTAQSGRLAPVGSDRIA